MGVYMCGGKILLYPMHETGHVGSVMATMDSIRSPPHGHVTHAHTTVSTSVHNKCSARVVAGGLSNEREQGEIPVRKEAAQVRCSRGALITAIVTIVTLDRTSNAGD